MKLIIHKFWMVMAILCLSISASAYDIEVDGIYYNIFAASKTAKVTYGEEHYSGNLTIPESVSYSGHNLSVVGIDDSAFADCSTMVSIHLPNTITTIGSNVFIGCTSLVSISLPDLITSIGYASFKNCSSLSSIKLPNSITCITPSSFEGCTSLVSIDLPSNITSIGSSAFEGCTSLVSINLPSNLVSIGDYAFSGCSSLTSIELPNNLTSIGEIWGPFKNCSSLLEIVLPEGVTKIPQETFAGCSALSEITLSSQLTSIRGNSLRGCSSLEKIGNMNYATYSEPTIFWSCESLKELVVGNGLSGFPFKYSYNDSGLYAGSYSKSTLDSEISYQSYGGGSKYQNYLQDLKRIIIEDSEEDFSIKVSFDATGDKSTIPAFSKIDLEYFYVGRPLIDNKGFSYGYYVTDGAGHLVTRYINYEVKVAQGYGHVGTLEIGGLCTEVPYFYQKIDTLILGEKITKLDASNLYVDDLSTIICKTCTPPVISNVNRITSNNYLKTIVLVPIGCREAYSNATGWENFWNIEESDYASKVDQSFINSDLRSIKVYNLEGRLIKQSSNISDIQELPHGIYIIVSEKGSMKIKI